MLPHKLGPNSRGKHEGYEGKLQGNIEIVTFVGGKILKFKQLIYNSIISVLYFFFLRKESIWPGLLK